MGDQPITLHVRGNVEAEILGQAVKRYGELYGGSPKFSLDTQNAIGVENIFTPDTIEVARLAIEVGTFLSVLFYLTIDIVEKVRRVDWNHQSFLKAIETEMKQQGVSDYVIERFTNFGCLLGKGDCPCEVTITSSKSSRGYRILLFRDGKRFTFEVGYQVIL
jgi:hypothetical protein